MIHLIQFYPGSGSLLLTDNSISALDICIFFRIVIALIRHLSKAEIQVDVQEQNHYIQKVSSKKCPVEYIGQNSKQLKARMTRHGGRGKCGRPIET